MTPSRTYSAASLIAALAVPLALSACGTGSAEEPGQTVAESETSAAARQELAITVHKRANCTCCQRWVEHLRENGFEVTAVEEPPAEMRAVKRQLNVPRELYSCHTATVNGYVIEGHVPAEVIRRFVARAPEAVGLTTRPRMPIGSPGMETGDPEPYKVVAFDEEGNTTVVARRGPDEQS